MAEPQNAVVNHNDDVLTLVRWLDAYMDEAYKSQSAGAANMVVYDFNRNKEYLANVSKFLDWVADAPQLDMPATHPAVRPLPPMAEIPPVNSPIVAHLLGLFTRFREEIAHSTQSLRVPSGLHFADMERCRAFISKVEKYLDDYVQSVSPLDMPESDTGAPVH